MNKVILVGNIGSIKKYEKVLGVSIATNKSSKDKDGEWQQKTTWHNVKVFGKYIDSLYGRISQGDLVELEGEIDYSVYKEKNYTNIVTNGIKVLRKAGESTGASDRNSASTSNPQTGPDLPF